MAKEKQNKDENKLEYFCSQLTKSNKRALKKYAADKDMKLYEALNALIEKGLQR